MSVTTVFMVRHAAHGHLGAVLSGRMPDIGLSHEGRHDAARLARHFEGLEVEAVYSSPVQRARETAEPIAAAARTETRISEELNEINFGEWTGASFDTLAGDPRWESWNRARETGCPPDGEPMRAAQARIVEAIETWRGRHPNGRVVAVSHADMIKAALCQILGLSLDRHAAFEIDPASVSTVVVWPEGGKVLGVNARPSA